MIQGIDASGKTAEGKPFDGIAGFKTLILERKRDFARQTTAKLLGYALGRSLVDRDDGTIEAIVDKLADAVHDLVGIDGRPPRRLDLLVRNGREAELAEHDFVELNRTAGITV